MSKNNTIISKMLSTHTYYKWVYPNGQAMLDGPGITINGGAGVLGGDELLSGRKLEHRGSNIPVGVHTYVDDETLAKLMEIDQFKRHIEQGLITVVKGEKCGQDRTDEIAAKDMLDSDHIEHRPFSEQDIIDAGGKINRDGSVDISEATENIEALRTANAGQPTYVKKRNIEEKANERASKKRATTRRKKG